MARFPDAPTPIVWNVPCSTGAVIVQRSFNFSNTLPLHYRVRWGAITAGRGLIEVVGEETIAAGGATQHLSMHIATTGLTGAVHHYDEQSDSWIDARTLLTRRYTKQTREANYLQDEVVSLDQSCQRYDRYEYRLDKNTRERKQGVLNGETLDILGYLFYARSLPLHEGMQFNVTLLSGDHLWPVTVNVEKRLKISSAGHWYDCFYLEPVLRDSPVRSKLKQVQLWITADDRRLPVRLRMQANVGHITAELVEDATPSP